MEGEPGKGPVWAPDALKSIIATSIILEDVPNSGVDRRKLMRMLAQWVGYPILGVLYIFFVGLTTIYMVILIHQESDSSILAEGVHQQLELVFR